MLILLCRCYVCSMVIRSVRDDGEDPLEEGGASVVARETRLDDLHRNLPQSWLHQEEEDNNEMVYPHETGPNVQGGTLVASG